MDTTHRTAGTAGTAPQGAAMFLREHSAKGMAQAAVMSYTASTVAPAASGEFLETSMQNAANILTQDNGTQDNGTQDNGTAGAPLPGSIGAMLAQSSGANGTQEGAAAVRAITEADKAAAADILTAARGKVEAAAVLKTKGEGLFGTTMRHVAVNGATFDGIEAAAPELKTDKTLSATFRPIKSMILKAQSLGLPLVDAEGKPLSKTALAAANKAKEGTKGKGTQEGAEGETLTATPQEVTASVFRLLRESAEMRDLFSADILAVAEMYKRDVEIAEAARIAKEAAAAAGTAQGEADAKATAEREAAEAAEAARQAQAIADNAKALEADYAAANLTKQDAPKAKGKGGRKAKEAAATV